MILDFLLNLLFPKSCRGCGKNGTYICDQCFEKINIVSRQCCPRCRRKNDGGIFCGENCKNGFYFEQLVVCTDYAKNALIKKLLVLFKYKFSMELSSVFGKIIEKEFFNFRGLGGRGQSVLIVPVPLHKKRLKYRGFNQSKILAEQIVTFDKKFILCDCLKKIINTPEQAKLSKTERLANLENAFSFKENFGEIVAGKTIILVDDIATTMSTINECSKVLKECGAKYICAIVLARGK